MCTAYAFAGLAVVEPMCEDEPAAISSWLFAAQVFAESVFMVPQTKGCLRPISQRALYDISFDCSRDPGTRAIALPLWFWNGSNSHPPLPSSPIVGFALIMPSDMAFSGFVSLPARSSLS